MQRRQSSWGSQSVQGSGAFRAVAALLALRRLPSALSYSSLVRGTSKRRSRRWVRPNISSGDRSVGASTRRTKVAGTGVSASARVRCALAYTNRDTPSPCRRSRRTRSGRSAHYSSGGRSGASAQPATCAARAPAVTCAWRRSRSVRSPPMMRSNSGSGKGVGIRTGSTMALVET
jgi:hypothetical protein